MELKLVRPTKEHENQALEFRKEFFDNGENVIKLWRLIIMRTALIITKVEVAIIAITIV